MRNNIGITASQLSLLARSGDAIFSEPITITASGCVLDGYARVHLARQQGRLTLPALELELSESAALQSLLGKHRRSSGLNDFNRISLALELEPWFRERAIFNQQYGGQRKGSSNLTEAERVDVRSEIAEAAGVSTGNVSKARRLLSDAHPQVLSALRTGEVSIHQASIWLRKPNQQVKQLQLYQNRRGITRAIQTLLNAHHRTAAKNELDLCRIVSALAEMTAEQKETVFVAEVECPGNVVLVSPALLQALTHQRELLS